MRTHRFSRQPRGRTCPASLGEAQGPDMVRELVSAGRGSAPEGGSVSGLPSERHSLHFTDRLIDSEVKVQAQAL